MYIHVTYGHHVMQQVSTTNRRITRCHVMSCYVSSTSVKLAMKLASAEKKTLLRKNRCVRWQACQSTKSGGGEQDCRANARARGVFFQTPAVKGVDKARSLAPGAKHALQHSEGSKGRFSKGGGVRIRHFFIVMNTRRS